MNTNPQIQSVQPTAIHTSTVVIGRKDFLSVLFRLISAEMYKIQRRATSKILLVTGLCIILLVFLIIAVEMITVLSTPLQYYGLQQCSTLHNSQNRSPVQTNCLNRPPTQKELAQAQKIKQISLLTNSEPLRLPTSLYITINVMMVMGTILFIILAGSIVGNEYSEGTIRLMNTRGPTRIQFLLSKIGTTLICLIVGFIILVVTGILVGALLNLLSEIPTSWDFLNKGNWIHALLYPLAALFGLLVYAMFALFLTILGRATVVGVTGVVVWWIAENILSTVPSLLMNVNDPARNFLKIISDYCISSNINALLQNQTRYFISFVGADDSPSSLSNQHALLVLTGYVAIFITLSIWISVRRDITN